MSVIRSHLWKRLLLQKSCLKNSLRNIVSPAYSCNAEWQERLKSEALSKIDSASHFRKVKQAFDVGSFVSALDMDIVSNKLHDIHPLSMELLDSLYYKFRHTKEAIHALDSTSYAFIRALTDYNEYDKILEFLEDKPNYGLFLDDHTAVMLLDHFLEEKSYNSALRIVFDIMLQEDLNDPIVNALSLYACHQFIKHTQDLKIVAPPAPPEKPEIVYRKVAFIDNPWYDDHFDMYSVNQKLGKSLTMLCSPADAVSRGYLFIGNVLYLKFDRAMSLLESWMETCESSVISEHHLNLAESFLRNIETASVEVPALPGLVRLGHLLPHVTEEQKAKIIADFEVIKDKLVQGDKIAKDVDEDKYMRDLVDGTLAEHEGEAIEGRRRVFREWNERRDGMLADHLARLADRQKKDDIAKRLLDLKTKEEKLKYFEEKVNIDLALEGRPEYPEIQDVVMEEQFVAPPGERKSSDKKKSK